MTFTLPFNEANRLKTLYSYNILDTSSEESFDSITKIASTICETPISAISFMDKDRQWYKSVEGFDISETNREVAFCSHTILQDGIFIVNDTLEDNRFSSNPFVTDQPKIRFYAGVPLKTHDGHNIGTLCVFDFKPRHLSKRQLDMLSSLSIQVISLLELKVNLDKLENNQANFNVLLENTDISIWSIDRSYKLTSFNSSFRQLFEDRLGFSPVIGKNLDELIISKEKLLYWKNLYNRALQGEKFTIESEIILKDKINIYIESSFNPIINNNQIIGATIFTKNITERKQNDLKLIESENKFKAAFDLSPIGMALILPNNQWIKINKSLSNIFGYTQEELFTKKLEDLAYPDDTDKTNAENYQKLLKNEINSYQLEKCYYHKDGHIICLSINISAVFNDIDKLSYLILQAEDITERKDWEKRLLFKSNILQNVEDSIIITDLEGNITYWNQGATSVFGYSQEEVLGKKTEILYSSSEQKKTDTSIRVLNGNILKIDWKAKTKYGNEIWIDLKKTVLKDKDGKAIGFIGVSRDITHKKEVEDELIKAKETAEQALQIKSKFMATMSHEIRTPMNGIVGMTDLLLNTPLNVEQVEFLDIIKKSSDILFSIINDMLDFSKFESKKMKLEKVSFDLRKSMDEVFSGISKLAKDKGIDFTYFISDEIPKYLLGDINRIKKSLLNLLSNGLKFSKKGELYISIELLKNIDNIFTLKFLIRDNGIGMTKETINNLFQAFSQADSSTSRKYGGTGLGLAITKSLIELMNGKIWVESTLGKGSDFYFTLDLESTDSHQINKKNFDKQLNPDSEFATYYPFNILLTEDNLINQKLAKKMLEKLGYKIDIANNGLEAIEAVKNKQYDVIFMDVQMPEMDGLEATQYIKNNVIDSKQPKIIALTANAMQGDREICLKAGMIDYLAKPVSIKILQDVLIKWFK